MLSSHPSCCITRCPWRAGISQRIYHNQQNGLLKTHASCLDGRWSTPSGGCFTILRRHFNFPVDGQSVYQFPHHVFLTTGHTASSVLQAFWLLRVNIHLSHFLLLPWLQSSNVRECRKSRTASTKYPIPY